MSIILCGFQGVGKTYFGSLVSKKLGLPFFDVDEYILAGHSVSIREYYQRVGGNEFRKREAEVVLELCKKESAVIALGGGSLMDRQSQEAVKRAGRLIYLYLPKEELRKSIDILPAYLANKDEAFDRMFEERHEVFSGMADETICLLEASEDEVVHKIGHGLGLGHVHVR